MEGTEKTIYAACPSEGNVPADVDRPWAQTDFAKTDDGKVVHPTRAKLVRTWTEP
jgi:hypothetical protein